MELFPDYIRHLKEFISAIDKSPATKTDSSDSSKLSEAPQQSSAVILDFSRKSTDQKQKSRLSTDREEKPRRSTDQKERPRNSTDKKDKSRKSVDHPDKANDGEDSKPPEKPRKSIDR